MKDYYAILNIPLEADDELIKSAYRKQSSFSHPDTVKEDLKEWANVRQKELNDAYETLIDQARRREYDAQYNSFKNEQHPSFQAFLPRAGFFVRLMAYVIDLTIMLLIFMPIIITLYAFGFMALDNEYVLKVITILLLGAYNGYLLPKTGQTIGKRILGLKVILLDGTPISPKAAFLRCSLGYFLSSIIFGMGFLKILWDKQNQGLHDSMYLTYVIQRYPTKWPIAIPLFLICFGSIIWLNTL